MIKFEHRGSFKNAERMLMKSMNGIPLSVLNEYGEKGVNALSAATPKDSGKTADSWGYNITSKNGVHTLNFTNANIQNGVLVAVLIQYGHAAKSGGWIAGHDYINPALQPILDELTEKVCGEVKKR